MKGLIMMFNAVCPPDDRDEYPRELEPDGKPDRCD